MNLQRPAGLAGATLLSLLALALPSAHAAAGDPDLATARAFAVLAASTVTNTGPSTVNGDLGVSPGTAVTGFGPGVVAGGTVHLADAVAATAQDDLTTAYDVAAALPATAQVTADLGGRDLVPGVYAGPTLTLTGALTLDAGGDPNAVFVFKAGSTLITASGSSVLLIGGADPCNVYWQVGSSATLGTSTSMAGSVMALQSITANTGANVLGRLLARNGAVTLDTNVVSRPLCATTTPGTPTPTATATTSPTPTATASVSPTASSSATPAATASTAPSAGPATSSPTPSAPPVTGSPSAGPLPTAAPAPGAPAPGVPAPGVPAPGAPAPGAPAPGAPAPGVPAPGGPVPAAPTPTATSPDSGGGVVTSPIGASATPGARSPLPVTGAPALGLARLALLLAAVGLVLLAVGRRRTA